MKLFSYSFHFITLRLTFTECRLIRQSLRRLIREERSRSAAFIIREMLAILSAVHAMVRSIIFARNLPQLSFSSCYLRDNIPECEGKEKLEQLVNCFDRTYVSGRLRSIQRPNAGGSVPVIHLRRIPPST